jgi:hypothetical protein
MYKKSLAIILLLASSLNLVAQKVVESDLAKERLKLKLEKRNRINELIRNEEEGFPAFRKQFTFQVKSAHDGFGAIFEKGWMKSPYKLNFFQLEIGSKRHEKELRFRYSIDQGNPYYTYQPPVYVYGKQNNFYQLKMLIGKQLLVGGKANKNGVGLYFNYAIGFTAGFIRPYYIDVVDTSSSRMSVIPIKYDDPNKDLFLNDPLIYGGTGLKYGWNEMTFVPGFHSKASLRFDWARFNQTISALEIGFEFDYYTQKVVQMVNNPGKSFFPTGYIGLVFGNRK